LGGATVSGQERNAQFTRALAELRSMVLRGQFEASHRLGETSLAERLGISRTPIRQAMDRLVQEGLLERIETGGCRVASFSFDDIVDAIELRGVLEGTAARLAAERGADPDLLEEAGSVLKGLDAAVADPGRIDFPSYVRLNARFHDLIARMSGSAMVVREVKRAARLPVASPSAFLQGQEVIPDFRDSLTRAQSQHRAIFDAIVSREGSRAEHLTREHARLARQNLEYVMNEKPSLAERVPGLALVSSG